MAYITSKLAGGVDYAFYAKGENGINVVVDTISIDGGAGVIDKRTLITPEGVVTFIDDEKLEKLKSHPVFQIHLKNGFVTIADTEKAAKNADKDLEEDKSSQITPDDYEKGNSKKDIMPGKVSKPKTKKR